MGLDLLRPGRLAAALAAAALVLPVALALASQPARAEREEAVRAAFVYKFLSFVEWPEEALGDEAVTLCVLGASELHGALELIRERHDVKGRPLALRRLSGPEEAAGCHAVFAGRAARDVVPALLRSLAGDPVLTVSDLPGFASEGGMIGLHREDGRLRFAIDRGAAQRAGLGLSARLLRLATEVRP